MEHVRWLSKPILRSPVVIAAFTGWNDARERIETLARMDSARAEFVRRASLK